MNKIASLDVDTTPNKLILGSQDVPIWVMIVTDDLHINKVCWSLPVDTTINVSNGYTAVAVDVTEFTIKEIESLLTE
jgi:hypothetical protein